LICRAIKIELNKPTTGTKKDLTFGNDVFNESYDLELFLRNKKRGYKML